MEACGEPEEGPSSLGARITISKTRLNAPAQRDPQHAKPYAISVTLRNKTDRLDIKETGFGNSKSAGYE
jgi:hypothetical protein